MSSVTARDGVQGGYRTKSSERPLGGKREGKALGMECVAHWEGPRPLGSLMD